jgi:hypothetical protein
MRPQFSPHSSRVALSLPPPPEHGVNVWILSTARRCELSGCSSVEAFNSIMGFAGHLRHGRQLSRSEVERAITTAYGTPHKAGDSAPRVASLSPADLARLCPPISEAAAQAFVASSPLNRAQPTAEVLSMLFGPDEFIALKQRNQCRPSRCQVRNLPELLASSDKPFQFTTSSPITGRLSQTQDGRLSYAAKECFTVQRFVVIEFDGVAGRDQFSRVLWLKERAGFHAPLVMMLKSGGESFHSWFAPTSAAVADQLKNAGVKLGADPAAMRIHQPVRCPNQRRDNGNLQEVLWLAHPSTPF